MGQLVTPRQLEIWRLAALGSSNPRIARTLGLADNTVKHHLRSLHLRLGVTNRVGLTLAAVHCGVVSSADIQSALPARAKEVLR